MPVRGRAQLLGCAAVVAIACSCAATSDLNVGRNAFLRGDYPVARRALLLAAEGGNAEAEHLLGVSWRDGLGVPPDRERAEAWLRRAVEHGDPGAAAELAWLYLAPHASPADETTTRRAIALLRRADAAAYPMATVWLADLYLRGVIEEEPPTDLVNRLGQLARQSDSEAQYTLGALELDRGNEQDGLGWLRIAASRGHLQAQLKLARYVRSQASEGPVHAAGLAEARAWYERLAVQAFEPSRRLHDPRRWLGPLAAFELGGIASTSDISSAVRW
jgi:TPR repeat protein